VLTWEAKKEAIFEMPVRARATTTTRARYPRARFSRESRAIARFEFDCVVKCKKRCVRD